MTWILLMLFVAKGISPAPVTAVHVERIEFASEASCLEAMRRVRTIFGAGLRDGLLYDTVCISTDKVKP